MSVLLSLATMESLDGSVADISFDELGPVVMKRLPEPVPLFRACRRSTGDLPVSTSMTSTHG